jgi:DNA (cytosine-5)-methyltransferase 1
LQTFPDGYRVVGTLAEVHRQVGNAVPSALAEILALEIRRQLLDERASSRSVTLLPPKRLPIPRAEPVRSVPRKYEPLAGIHDPHPGTGMGYGALRRA